MNWQTIGIVAGVFVIGLLLGRALGGARSDPGRPPDRAAPPRLAGAARHEAGNRSVRLVACGANKIAVIKELRGFTLLGLKETKDMADAAPSTVASGLSRAAAEDLVQLLRNAGADAEVV